MLSSLFSKKPNNPMNKAIAPKIIARVPVNKPLTVSRASTKLILEKMMWDLAIRHEAAD